MRKGGDAGGGEMQLLGPIQNLFGHSGRSGYFTCAVRHFSNYYFLHLLYLCFPWKGGNQTTPGKGGEGRES